MCFGMLISNTGSYVSLLPVIGSSGVEENPASFTNSGGVMPFVCQNFGKWFPFHLTRCNSPFYMLHSNHFLTLSMPPHLTVQAVPPHSPKQNAYLLL